VSTMRMTALVCVAVLLVTLGGCAPQEARVTEADDGESVRLKVGDTFTVALPGNPSTGYSWNGSADPEVVVLTGEPEFAPDAADENVVGAGGTVTMTYEAVKAGEADLKLQYSRVWESVQPQDTFSVTVVVSE
jgi:inhibitor of cysteine peptidase